MFIDYLTDPFITPSIEHSGNLILLLKVVRKLDHGVLVTSDARTIERCIFLVNIHQGSGCVHAFHFAEVCSGIPYSTGLGGGQV